MAALRLVPSPARSQCWMSLCLPAVHPNPCWLHTSAHPAATSQLSQSITSSRESNEAKGFFFLNFRAPVNNREHELCHEGDANCWLLHFLLPPARWELFYWPIWLCNSTTSALPKSAAGAQLPRGSWGLHAPRVHPPLLPRVSWAPMGPPEPISIVLPVSTLAWLEIVWVGSRHLKVAWPNSPAAKRDTYS